MDALDAILDEIADRVAARVSERLPVTSVAPEYVDQRTCGFDRGVYLRAARAGKFPATKKERLWIARRADVAAWLETREDAAMRASSTINVHDLDKIRRRVGLKAKGR